MSDRRAMCDDLNEWREFIDRIDVIEVPIEAFLDTLVPTGKQYVPDDHSGHRHRRRCLPEVKEPVSRSVFTAFVSSLVDSFPLDKKVSFSDRHRPLPAPFQVLEDALHVSLPDIGVSFPGIVLEGSADRWQQVSMVIELEGRASCDPFDRDDLLCSAVTHPAASARSLMLAHGFLASFALGVYGTRCRILRFDHTAGLVSPSFDYSEQPDLLRQFFWHFVHPRVGDTVVGCDPTVHALRHADIVWAEVRLAKMRVRGDAALVDRCRREGRRVDVPDDSGNSTRSFLLLKALSAERRLFSRATTVWLAIEDTRRTPTRRGRSESPESTSTRLVIVKEAWREIETRSEAVIYQMLQDAQGEERFGLPKLVCGSDLGERDIALWKAGVGPTSDALRNTISDSGKYPLPFPQHQTYSWRLVGELENAHRERSQMRLVIDVVGRPLSRFRSTKELVQAIYDAVRGHENAWKMGILHRDISEGNVLLVDEDLATASPFTAFLHDFDYSWFKSRSGGSDSAVCTSTSGGRTPCLDDAILLGQTGTPPFMAIEIHKQRTLRYLGHAVKHEVHHDLESFYWLLVWMTLRHARYLHAWGARAESTLFGCSDHTFFASMKAVWLDTPALAVCGNAPLTRLLRRFADAVRANNPGVPDCDGSREQVHLTHASVLEMLSVALSSDGWPEDDAALSRQEREAWRSYSALQPGEKRPHEISRDEAFPESVLDMAGDLKRRRI